MMVLEALDEQPLKKHHLRMVITAGMGFFTDAYDLFIIGVVTTLLIPIWHLTITQIAFLNGISLAAAAFGAVVFGWLADKLGRKKMYGIEVLILFFGALGSAAAPSFTWLLISRIIIGFGIGGDYPTSAVVASEFSNRKNRGFLVLLIFAMQALGLIVGPMIAALFFALHMPSAVAWRLLLALGAIPALSVFYLRRRIAETPRYLLSKNKIEAPFEVSRVVSDLTGYQDQVPAARFQAQKLFSSKWMKCLFGTAGAWFLLDVALYGNGVSSMMIMNAISPHTTLLTHTLLSTLLFLCFALPGYWCAAKYVDRIGRKRLQLLGFFAIAICYLGIALIPNINNYLWAFIGLFGLSFFFINFGPNATTFLIPSEIYPTNIRARAHGISAAIGKVGAFLGALLLPFLLKVTSLELTMAVLAIISILGMLVSFLVPEMKATSLEASEIIVEAEQA